MSSRAQSKRIPLSCQDASSLRFLDELEMTDRNLAMKRERRDTRLRFLHKLEMTD